MIGLFGALDMASQSLDTQMTGVDVTGQNLANVNTTGYARQTVNVESSPDISTSFGSEGTGANVTSIQQIVSSLLNTQIQNQQSVSGYWSSQQSALQSAQTGLDEFLNGSGSTNSTSSSANDTSSSGLSAQLSGLFSAFSSLAASPTSASAQQAVISQAQSLSTSFNQVNTQLSDLNTSLNSSLTSDVGSANQLLSNIADLNGEITSAEFSGGTANSLVDTREQDLENLSKLVSIQTSTGTGGAVNVSIDGQDLIAGSQTMDTLQTVDPGDGQLQVQTATGGVTLNLSGGSMQGTITARDGTLASLQSGLNTLATTLINQVNTIQNAGYTTTGTTGNSFFTGTGAGDIGVNAALVNDPSLIQTSGTATAGGDNTVALQLASLGTTSQAALNNQTFSNSYDGTVADLGDALSNANDQVTNQTAVTTMLQTQQSDVSGVNIDQEMTNLMGFQRAYEASAQLVTTINTMMGDTLAMKAS
jgi:flagellar hook-associated protein 1 FlgK